VKITPGVVETSDSACGIINDDDNNLWGLPAGIATPPRGTAPVGDIWAFAGWKLYHSVNGGHNFSAAWTFYHPSHTLAVGALPPTRYELID
jgi:hypothetical protein